MLSLIRLYYKIWDRGTMCADTGRENGVRERIRERKKGQQPL